MEKIRAPLINEYKEWLKTWTDEEIYRFEKVLVIYRGDPNMRRAVLEERDKMFKSADVDEDGLLNREEFEEYFNWAVR